MTTGRQGLLEQGQRRRIRRGRRTVLRDYGPEEAASSRRRAVGIEGPFQGLRADREQRTPPTTPPGPQYLQGTTGRTGLLRDYGPSFYTPIDRQGSGLVAKRLLAVILFQVTPAYLTFGEEAWDSNSTQDILSWNGIFCTK